ncbi:MAG: CysZ protein [Candidatus Sumerlaeota bacterium]|nr:CysZ protein [Candidatus Sumerlaeota bacterium]
MLRQTTEVVREVVLNPEPLGFGKGVAAPLLAVGYLVRRAELVGLCLGPWVFNFLIVFPISFFLTKWLIFDNAREFVLGLIVSWPGWVQDTTTVLLALLLIPFCLMTAAVFFLIGAILSGAPFHDMVGERVEKEKLGGRPDLRAPSMTLWAGVRHALFEAGRRLLILVPALVLVLLVGLIPLIGPVVAFLLQGVIAAVFLTLDAFAMPMDRRGITTRAKLRWLWANRRFAVGFGVPMLLIPCSIVLMPPVAAVAASMVYSDLLLMYHPEEVAGEPPAGPADAIR